MKSLRLRVILASVLWTAGLLSLMHLVSLIVIHTLPAVGDPHTAIVGTLVGTVLMLAGGLVAWRSLLPLRGLEQKVLEVTRGQASRVHGAYPSEVQPVIDRLNAMLDDRERAIARAQAAAGDLAHALKTPLALLQREADAARSAGHTEIADAIAAHVRRMTSQVDRQLTRARIAASGPAATDRSLLAPHVDGLVRAMQRLHAERQLDISASVPPELAVRVRPEDIDEILGNLLDNACKWAHSLVRVTAGRDGARVRIVIDDDGEGLQPEAREAALARGVRLDEATPGSGLGLAIVRDLVEHYRGAVSLDKSSMGGLRAVVTLPAAT